MKYLKVLRSARALVAPGLVNHGWSYMNIDDAWQGTRTGKDGALQGNEKFPDMKALCEALHGMGLKTGIYSTPWMTSYANYPGGSSNSPDGAWAKDLPNDQAASSANTNSPPPMPNSGRSGGSIISNTTGTRWTPSARRK